MAKILFLSAEVAPYVSVGGLSQVMHFLPRALMKRGHDVRIFTPRYGAMEHSIRSEWKFRTDIGDLRVPIEHDNGYVESGSEAALKEAKRSKDALEHGGAAPTGEGNPAAEEFIHCSVSYLYPGRGDAPAYFLENKEYYALRANVFGYADDHVRFALLSMACLEWLLQMDKRLRAGDKKAWMPDIVHCQDWHTAYFIGLARRDLRYEAVMRDIPIVFTVHNLKYQGNYDFKHAPPEDVDDGIVPLAPLNSSLLQKQNPMKRGLMFCDAVTTVSPTHAKEILTPEYSEGLLDTLLRERGKLSGIMNGLDTKEFNPAADPLVYRKFSTHWFVHAREANKRNIQQEFSLSLDGAAPLLAYVGRLSSQKGLSLLVEAVGHLMEERPDVQFVSVGGGDDRFRNDLETLRSRFPSRVGLHLMPDFRLPRKVFSGADIMLIPSIFEPGGIVALEALRYGAVPVVRRTGGLNDSITDFDPSTRRGNGFSFVNQSAWALYGAIAQALAIYRQPALWNRLVTNCLTCDFSWDKSAVEYEDWYGRAIRKKRADKK